jgi:hypothetical protein
VPEPDPQIRDRVGVENHQTGGIKSV